MSTEENKPIVQRFWEEVVNQGNLDLVDELFSPDCVLHDPVVDPGYGPEAVKRAVKTIRTAFPDVEVTIEPQIAAEDNRVVTRWTGAGTHTGQVEYVRPTGQQVEVSGTSISRVANGQIEETWLVMVPFEPPGGMEGIGDWFCKHFPKLC